MDDAAWIAMSGVSAGLVKQLLKEMSALFPDEVMHIGARIPSSVPVCVA